MKPFEIWWAQLHGAAGRRPVLLLTRNGAYDYLNKFIAVEITTVIRNISVEVPLGTSEGLSERCVANCDDLRIVPKSALITRAGRLEPTRWIEVKRAVGAALAWRELTDLA